MSTAGPISTLRVALISQNGECGRRDTWLSRWKSGSSVGEISEVARAKVVELLRCQAFDVAVVRHSEELDGPDFMPTLTTMGSERMAIVVVADETPDALQLRCLTAGADYLFALPLNGQDATQEEDDSHRVFTWQLQRAVEHRLLRMNAKQWSTQLQKNNREDHHAAVHQVRALRSVLVDDALDPQPAPWLVDKITELLRAYAVAVSDDFGQEVGQLVGGLQQSGVMLTETLLAHSVATEQLLLGMGTRPAWHLLGRSQRLAYQLVASFSHEPAATLEEV